MLKTAPEPTAAREEGRSNDERRFDSMDVRRVAYYYLSHFAAQLSEHVGRQSHDSIRATSRSWFRGDGILTVSLLSSEGVDPASLLEAR
jgi:hypothetical protein